MSDQQDRRRGAAGEIERGEHLPVDEGREHVGAVRGSAAGQHIDHIEDAERVGQPHHQDDGDHRLQQRQDDARRAVCQGVAPSTRAASSGSVGRLASPASSTSMSKGSAIQRLAMTIDGAGEPDVGEPQRAACAECAGDGVDHPVAVDEDETPGERAHHRRHHQRQGDDRAEELAAAQARDGARAPRRGRG